MILPAISLALLLQAAPSSLSGVVLHGGNGAPLPNVRVALARTDASLGIFGQMVAGDHPPNEITFPGELLNLMATEMAAQASNPNLPPEASAEARAFNALPIADIEELVVSVNGEVAVVYKSQPPLETDAQGRFSFANVPPGTYKLIFSSNGFARQDFGQRSANGSGTPIILGAGQNRNDIVMRMTQVSAIGGRIADVAGHPLAGVPVQLLRAAYDDSGKRKMLPVASTQTDDRGLYRMFHLTAGRYYLSAGNTPGGRDDTSVPIELQILNGGAAVPATNRVPEKYTLNFFPGVPELASATAIDVPMGSDVAGVDMYLKPRQNFRIRGSIVDPRTGQPPVSANISLNLQNPSADPNASTYVNFGNNDGLPIYNATTGTFEIRNISPGAYVVTATLPNNAQPPRVTPNMTPEQQRAVTDAFIAGQNSAPRAFAAAQVTNADVEGLQLRIATSGALDGSVRIEQPAGAVGPAPELTFLRVQLRPVDTLGDAVQINRPPKADGTFRIDALWPGEYLLNILGVPAGFYVKAAHIGDLDLLASHLSFSGTGTGTIEIVLAGDSGQLDGSVTNAQGQPVAGARAVLIPERNRDRTELFKPVTSDPSGHFKISGIAPGDYKLAAWELIEPFDFFDADLLKQADDTGKPVHVNGASTQTVNLSAIPAR